MTKKVMFSFSLALALVLSGTGCRSKPDTTTPSDPSLADPGARKKPKDPKDEPQTKECPPGQTTSSSDPDVCVTSPEPAKPDPDDSER